MKTHQDRRRVVARTGLLLLAACVIVAWAIPGPAPAADVGKANNTTNLNLGTSWTGGTAPTTSDVAVFDTTYATTGTLNTGALVTWQGIRIASPGGNVVINNSTSGQEVALGSSGIDMSAATVNLNIQRLRVDASQDWNIASGRTFNVGNSGTARSGVLSLGSGGPFTITKKGAGTVQLDTSNTAIGNVNWNVQEGVIRAIWNGSSAWGTGAITLGGGGIATGTSFGGSVGNWTWNNNITLTSATSSFIDNQNNAGADRWLNLLGVISGSGNLEFRDTGTGFNNSNYGFILSATNTNTGTVTIASGAEVRVGSSNTSGSANTGNFGRLAAPTASVTNDGTLTFSRLDAHTVANNISGSGGVRVGLTATIGTATTTQNVTLSGTNTYSGTTTINNGTLTVTGSLSASSAVSVASASTLTGDGTAAGSVTVASGGILSPGVANAGTLTLGSLTFGSAVGNTASILMPVSAGGALTSQLSVNGNVVANGGASTVTFGFGSNLALLGAGTYTLLSYTGTQLADLSAFTYSGTTGSRQTVALVNASQAIDLSVGNAFVTWSGAQGSGWSTANNWTLSSDDQPTSFQASDVVIFDDAGDTGTVDLTANVNPVTVTFSGNTLAYTVQTANASGITTGNLVKTGAATVTINTANSFTGTQVTAGTLVLGNNSALGTGSVSLEGGALDINGRSITNAVTLAGGSIAGNGGTVSGVISETGGARSLVVGSDLTLTGANTYTGGTTINAGTLQIGSGSTTGTLGGGAVTIAENATLAFNRSNDLTASNAISGAGTLVKQGAGILTLTGTNAYSGTTISAGTLRVGSGGTSGTLGSGNVVNDAALSFNRSDSITVANTISGTGSLSHDSTGTTILTGTNTYTGVTTIRGNNGTNGEVRVSSINNGGVAGNLGQASSDAGNLVLGQTGASTGKLVYTGAGESTDRLFTIDGNTIIENSGAGPLNFTNTGNLGKTSGISQSLQLTGTNGGSLAASIVKGAGASDVTVVKNGTGTWTLTGVNTYTGTTTVNQGTLAVTGSGVLGGATGSSADANNIVFGSANSGAALRFETVANLGAADQIRFRNTGGTAGQGGALVYVGTTDQTLSKTIQCDTTIGMRIESNSVGGSLTLDGGFSQTNRPLYLGGTGTGNNTLAMAFNGSGVLTKRDAGTWLLSAVNGYSGGTELIGGSLRVNALSGIGSGYLAVKTGATFSYEGSGAETTTRNLFLDGGASRIDVTQATGSLSWNDSATKNGAFTKGGAGTLSLGGAFSGSASITVVDGRLTLTGASSASGTTTVSGGTLLVNGSLGSGSAVTVQAGGTLGGSGTIGGATTIFGTHSPGTSPGVQTFSGNLGYDGATVIWELTDNTATQTTPTAVFDQVLVGSNLDFTSATSLSLVFDDPASTVNWTDAFWDDDREWLVYDVAGTTSNFGNLTIASQSWVDGVGNVFTVARPQASFSLRQAEGSGDVILVYAAVPEPATLALLAAGLGLAGWAVARRAR